MKKLAIGIFSILLLVSGCRKKKTEVTPAYTVSSVGVASTVQDKKVKKLFVEEGEELESFTLADEQLFDEQGYPVLQLKDEISEQWMERPTAQKTAFNTIYFNFGSSEIRDDQKKNLDENAQKIKRLAAEGKTIIIEGHACKYAGSAEYNIQLSDERAREVEKYLIQKGVPRKSLKTVGRGFEMCLTEEDDMDAQSVNRRVEFYTNE